MMLFHICLSAIFVQNYNAMVTTKQRMNEMLILTPIEKVSISPKPLKILVMEPKPKKAYHHGIEIYYPQSMFDGAPYRECLGLPKNEDHTCSNSQKLEPSLFAVNRHIQDHVNYFNQRLISRIEIFSMKSNLFLFVMSFGILALAFGSPMAKNDNMTVPGEFLMRRGPMIRSEVFDPATNITHVWDMQNGTSQVHGNMITKNHASSSSSESKEN
ncbi:Lipase-3 domain-containing protein [Aphelenchoides besseyi]|nr:Lipase-3 domain-containing protein [Aphelenchoides besseyi]